MGKKKTFEEKTEDELAYMLDDIKEGLWHLANDEREELMESLRGYCSEDYHEKYGEKQ